MIHDANFLKYFELRAISEIDQLLAQLVRPGQIDESTYFTQCNPRSLPDPAMPLAT